MTEYEIHLAVIAKNEEKEEFHRVSWEQTRQISYQILNTIPIQKGKKHPSWKQYCNEYFTFPWDPEPEVLTNVDLKSTAMTIGNLIKKEQSSSGDK